HCGSPAADTRQESQSREDSWHQPEDPARKTEKVRVEMSGRECKPDAKRKRDSAQPQDAKRKRDSAQPQDAKRKRDSAQPQDAKRKRDSAQPQDAKRKRDSAQPQDAKRKRDSAQPQDAKRKRDSAQPQEMSALPGLRFADRLYSPFVVSNGFSGNLPGVKAGRPSPESLPEIPPARDIQVPLYLIESNAVEKQTNTR